MRMISIVVGILFFFSANSRGQVPVFDESRAFHDLKAQCAFGPRNPGSEGHRACLTFLMDELEKFADAVRRQPFLFTDPKTFQTMTLTNIVASFGSHEERILLCAHWDTRPWADRDPDPANRDKPILGANDGASGVAVLLGMARILKASPPLIGVDIVLFDGEDSGLYSRDETWCQGSRH